MLAISDNNDVVCVIDVSIFIVSDSDPLDDLTISTACAIENFNVRDQIFDDDDIDDEFDNELCKIVCVELLMILLLIDDEPPLLLYDAFNCSELVAVPDRSTINDNLPIIIKRLSS